MRTTTVRTHKRIISGARPMNKGLQQYKFKKLIGQNADLVDLHAEIDPTLTFEENRKLLDRYIPESEKAPGSISDIDNFLEAQESFDNRSLRSQMMDLRRRARNTIQIDDLSKKNLQSYRKKYNRMDIEGIDA